MNIELEILQLNYWEHFKSVKELSLIYPPENEKRISIQHEMDLMLVRINLIKQNGTSV